MKNQSKATCGKTSVRILCSSGLHTRCACELMDLLHHFRSFICIYWKDECVEANRVLDLLFLGAPRGAEIRIEAEGEDAQEAIEAINGFFRNGSNFAGHK